MTTTAIETLEPALTIGATPIQRSRARNAWRMLRANPLGTLGLVLLLIIAVAAVAAPIVAPYSPQNSHFVLLQKPSSAHPFGTDRLGRDILSRVIYGARVSMAVGFGSVVLGLLAGTLLGVISGYSGGWPDTLLQRFVDVMLAFPFIILALFLVTVIGRGLDKSIYVLGIAITPAVARVVRGCVLSERHREYIDAARATGATGPRVILRHLLPNISAPIIVLATTLLAGVVLAEASLSFLGLGVPPPTASWGGDLSGNARDFFETAPWMAIFPGLALTLTVLAFNFLGDALRDVLDPRLQHTLGKG
jgi:peptide/nickel transport system permease protein